MDKEHPNIALLKQFDPANVAGTADVFAEDVVFHYFNPLLPDLHGGFALGSSRQAMRRLEFR
jgi:hypothetical protein